MVDNSNNNTSTAQKEKKRAKLHRTASWFNKNLKNRILTKEKSNSSKRNLLIEIPEGENHIPLHSNSAQSLPVKSFRRQKKTKSLKAVKQNSFHTLERPQRTMGACPALENVILVVPNDDLSLRNFSQELIIMKDPANNNNNYPILPSPIQDDIRKFSMSAYASNYFQEFQKKKPNIFTQSSKNDPTKKILQHTKIEIKETILILQSSVQEKALDIFVKIQYYMGDRLTTKSLTDIAISILSDTIAIPQIRDEIYCQLVKQTTNNPTIESEEKGWELFSLLLETVLPTQDFENYIKAYFAKSVQEKDNPIRQIAISCYNRIEELTKGIPKIPKVPTQEQIKYYKELPFLLSSFHVTLEELMLRQDPDELNVPIILQTLVEGIKQNDGLAQPNIFRNTTSASDTFALKLDLEYHGGRFSNPPSNTYLMANTLKLWLKDIRTPIIPPELYQSIIQNSTHFPTLQEIIMNQLPIYQRNVLIYIVKFLQNIAEFKEKNKMTEEGLSVVISPSLCRCPEQNPFKAVQYTKDESLFVMTLITDWKE